MTTNFAATMQAGTKPPKIQKPPSRRGTRGWVVHLDPDRHRRLKVAAVMHDTSLQALGVEPDRGQALCWLKQWPDRVRGLGWHSVFLLILAAVDAKQEGRPTPGAPPSRC